MQCTRHEFRSLFSELLGLPARSVCRTLVVFCVRFLSDLAESWKIRLHDVEDAVIVDCFPETLGMAIEHLFFLKLSRTVYSGNHCERTGVQVSAISLRLDRLLAQDADEALVHKVFVLKPCRLSI